VLVTEQAQLAMQAAYGPLLESELDPRALPPSLAEQISRVPAGTPYVFSILKPLRTFAMDWTEVGQALSTAAGGVPIRVPDGDYAVIAGLRGELPSLVRAANRPFEESLDLSGVHVSIRMESWLNMDTIRRMGFGQVIADGHHALIVERG